MFYAIYMKQTKYACSEQASKEAARAILGYLERDGIDFSVGVYDRDANVLYADSTFKRRCGTLYEQAVIAVVSSRDITGVVNRGYKLVVEDLINEQGS